MKYDWKSMADDNKHDAIAEELRLKTHNGTTKDDLLEAMRFLGGEVERCKKALGLACSQLLKIRCETEPMSVDVFDLYEQFLQQAKAGEAD